MHIDLSPSIQYLQVYDQWVMCMCICLEENVLQVWYMIQNPFCFPIMQLCVGNFSNTFKETRSKRTENRETAHTHRCRKMLENRIYSLWFIYDLVSESIIHLAVMALWGLNSNVVHSHCTAHSTNYCTLWHVHLLRWITHIWSHIDKMNAWIWKMSCLDNLDLSTLVIYTDTHIQKLLVCDSYF